MHSVFLFPHQDDEFGVFYCIEQAVKSARKVHCLYYTDGGDTQGVRNNESIKVLTSLGVSIENIHFFGDELSVPDGKLLYHIDVIYNSIMQFWASLNGEVNWYVPAWEGGHPDHDALHAVAIRLINKLEDLDRVRQFPLYNADKCMGPFFRVMHPLPINGVVESLSMPLQDRLRYITKVFSYKSQWKTWVGLFPFFFYKYAFVGEQSLQGVRVSSTFCKPHEGDLYYDYRGFESYSVLSRVIECEVNLE